tara:strand:+ start:760 stop:1233 length:474 start_codon:yes stop_codon:yes gene_type:complete
MNQPAIETTESGEYEISLVPKDQVILIWNVVEKFIQKSSNRSNGRIRPQDVLNDLLNNGSQLWIIFDTGSFDIIGVQITLFNYYPTGKKMLNLEHTSGKKMQEWIEKGLEVVTKYAKDTGCHGLEGMGRHGQWNWVKNKKGWKKPATFYEYNFEDDV